MNAFRMRTVQLWQDTIAIRFFTNRMAIQTINKVLVGLRSFPAACTPGMNFFHQCTRWWKKLFLWSARRPKIREDFRRAQHSLFASKNPTGFFDALGFRHQ